MKYSSTPGFILPYMRYLKCVFYSFYQNTRELKGFGNTNKSTCLAGLVKQKSELGPSIALKTGCTTPSRGKSEIL